MRIQIGTTDLLIKEEAEDKKYIYAEKKSYFILYHNNNFIIFSK